MGHSSCSAIRTVVSAVLLLGVATTNCLAQTYPDRCDAVDNRKDMLPTIRPISDWADCDGKTDVADKVRQALAAAHDGKFRLTGQGKTCAVSGNIVLPDMAWLEDVKFKQLDPNNPSRVTLRKADGRGPVTLKNVTVDRNGAPTDGDPRLSPNNAGGIEINNIDDVCLENIEIFGDGPGFGIRIFKGNRQRVFRPYVHDMNWVQPTDPGTEQNVGIWHWGTDIYVAQARVKNLTGKIGTRPYIKYQTDGIDCSGCINAIFREPMIENVAEGTDVSGSNHNEQVWFLSPVYKNIGSTAQKWAHQVSNSGSVNTHCTDVSLSCILVGGAPKGEPYGPTKLRFTDPIAINTGSDHHFSKTSVGPAAFNIYPSRDDPKLDPQDIQFINARAIDNQSIKTMKWGFRDASTRKSTKLINFYVSGAAIADTIGFEIDGKR